MLPGSRIAFKNRISLLYSLADSIRGILFIIKEMEILMILFDSTLNQREYREYGEFACSDQKSQIRIFWLICKCCT